MVVATVLGSETYAVAKKLLELQKKVAPDLLKIDGYKDQLRDLCEKNGAGFTEEVEGLGTVDVKAGREAECKGVEPRLNIQKFLSLDAAEQTKLKRREIVILEQIWSKAAKPSVTVRL